ncbi:MAG: hypothetical protein JXX28_07495 [Deltaproteobacteria bacterium]|nr:hypothetical protein [Deltaproteobacteria bacterium]
MLCSLLLALTLPAQAVELGVGLSGELESNDPFLSYAAPGLRLMAAPLPWVEVSLHGAVLPDRGDADLSAMGREVVQDLGVVPDLARIRQRGELTLALMPSAGSMGRWERRVGGYLGGGVVHTLDDLDALGLADDPVFLATEDQWHVSTVYGLSGELRRDALGLGVRLERHHYTEVVGTTTLETRNTRWVAVEGSWRFRTSSR